LVHTTETREEDVKLHKLIKRTREERSFTQTELAKRTKVSLGYLSRVESGQLVPGEDLLNRLAMALSLPMDEVLVAAGRLPRDVERFLIANPKAVARVRTMMGSSP
jgi:transcriptional regulator with XRE-family HTH domain